MVIYLPMERLHFSDEWLEQEMYFAECNVYTTSKLPMVIPDCQDLFLAAMERKIKLEVMGLQ